jgi:hypothetical protein
MYIFAKQWFKPLTSVGILYRRKTLYKKRSRMETHPLKVQGKRKHE